MSLSKYELERQAQIEANKRKLIELGIDDEITLMRKPKPPTKNRQPPTDLQAQPTRKSARVAQTPVFYYQLSDEFCLQEEKEVERNSTHPVRDRKKRQLLQDEQAAEHLKRQDESDRRRFEKQQLQQQSQFFWRHQAPSSSSQVQQYQLDTIVEQHEVQQVLAEHKMEANIRSIAFEELSNATAMHQYCTKPDDLEYVHKNGHRYFLGVENRDKKWKCWRCAALFAPKAFSFDIECSDGITRTVSRTFCRHHSCSKLARWQPSLAHLPPMDTTALDTLSSLSANISLFSASAP